eukprot:TRINITY_DN6293_c0_g1_i1.p1 TRINITY_DN6293_c0_g1~~TRINITY_DN6293_c0_g1_i1.p1  ORF type:complete len:353 (+),score=84.56 TRINITY_DN6293_c0_g1_i1:1106-2164(+)
MASTATDTSPHCARSPEDAAMGCFMGGFCGDAAGAVLEFLGHKPSAAEVRDAMHMPGGGAHKVAAGQVTDDSEEALALTKALRSSKDFNLNAHLACYHEWFISHPFDVGSTTRKAFGGVASADKAIENAIKKNADSKSNGCLMKIWPLAVWAHKLSQDDIAHCAIFDTKLSHSDAACQHACACYCLAIAHLVNNVGDRKGAFAAAQHWSNQHANAECKEWMQAAEQNTDVGYGPGGGFIKYAFVHAMRLMLHGSNYEQAIAETLRGGGDTDTNACIVGALVGAAVGVSNIPSYMTGPVLSCRPNHKRPSWLHPKVAHDSAVAEILVNAPVRITHFVPAPKAKATKATDRVAK